MASDQSSYPYLDKETYDNLLEINATPEQLKSANDSAKENINERLKRYGHKPAPDYESLKRHGIHKLRVVVVGETGSGKSATANTLLGEKRFEESSSAVSKTTEGQEEQVTLELPLMQTSKGQKMELSILDTPVSWNAKIKKDKRAKKDQKVHCYIFVINLASPRFAKATRNQLKRLKGANGKGIIDARRCFVVLSHADSALQQKSLKEYLTEIEGDALHSFLDKDMQGSMLAVNNVAAVKYEREKNQKCIIDALITCVVQKCENKKHGLLCVSSRVEDVPEYRPRDGDKEKKKRETGKKKDEFV